MLYIDLDGVMVNFHKAILKHTGKAYAGKKTWEILETIPNLFYSLEPCLDAFYGINFIESNFIPYEFLTALPLITGELHSAQLDKVRWVRDKLNSNAQVRCVQNWRHKKYFCREKHDILVDDCSRNIQEWKDAGGIGILHSNWFDTIEELKKYY